MKTSPPGGAASVRLFGGHRPPPQCQPEKGGRPHEIVCFLQWFSLAVANAVHASTPPDGLAKAARIPWHLKGRLRGKASAKRNPTQAGRGRIVLPPPPQREGSQRPLRALCPAPILAQVCSLRVMLPPKARPKYPKYFRPSCLIPLLYKVFGKILMNRVDE